MKKLTLAMLISLMICLTTSVISNANEVQTATDKLIRLHVIANSDSDIDQQIKLVVRDAILSQADALLSACQDKESAIEIISQNIDILTQAADSVLSDFDYNAICSLEKCSFNTRTYDDFTLPAGEYDSLCVRLGNAEGKNWWCVCYPGLCLPSAAKIEDLEMLSEDEIVIFKSPEKVRYKLFCFELFQRIKKFFC